jgi:type VI protein secretion system component VasK
VHLVAPKGCISEPIGQDVAGYVGGLAALANALQSIGPESNPNLSALDSASLAATTAANAADTLTLKFHLDPTDPNPKETVKSTSDRLLKDPITPVSKTLDAAKKGPVNGKAAETCAAVNPLFRKYPFNPKSPQEATQPELNDLLAPQTGRLWMFVNSDLMKPFLQEAGGRYVANISSNGSVTNSFRDFVNRAAAVRQAFYGTGGPPPNMQFTMHALQSGDVDHVQLTVDGSTLAGDPKTRPSQTFTWPGTSPGVSLSMGYGNGDDSFPSTSGTWAIWRFLDTAERGSWPNPEWIYRTTAGPIMHNGHPIVVKFSVDGPNAQVLSPGFLSGLVCPSPAIQ